MNIPPKTLYEKTWQQHLVHAEPDSPALLYIDLHLIHEVTSPQAFSMLREKGLRVRRPMQTLATVDHSIPTTDLSLPMQDRQAKQQIAQLEHNCSEFGIPLCSPDSERRGIVHVVGPELGLTQPGMTIVCGDSHTATHGAFGALSFGIGTSEVGHVLATQTLLQYPSKTMAVEVTGTLSKGVTAKDIILALIARIGVNGGTGCVIEYLGETIRSLDMESRMTICNMSIEAGARSGMIAPDNVTFEYLAGRPHAPMGRDWDEALKDWRSLPTDEGAPYDKRVTIDASVLKPMITFGTTPAMGMPIDDVIPSPERTTDAGEKNTLLEALHYMGLQPGEKLLGKRIDVVFIGSCTNGRINDLRMAATIFKGKKVANGLRVLVVPGSQQVKRQAEAEGLDDIFKSA
ncbi:3-isopropylmalate dehydratase large subunit, partial [candidate division KSB1 bacterium]|nr:3-isopropylmalate dehydratase large subunit [candidate division KSB1 bacterium]